MSEEIDEKIEEIVERKVEEKLEKKTRDEVEDSVIDQKIEEKIAEKVANRDKMEKQSFVEKVQNEGISRRGFLKMLGLGAGGLAASSAAAGVDWSVLRPASSGVSDVKSSTVKDGAITSSKIASNAVTQAKIAAGAVDTGQIAASAVGGTELSFDPATQTELNDHAGKASPHHSPPTVVATGTVTTDYGAVGWRHKYNGSTWEMQLYNAKTGGSPVTILSNYTGPGWVAIGSPAKSTTSPFDHDYKVIEI
ncbi:MAG: twin-arginine translocation signal domain-containing protein [Candidatus Nanohalobium sp.]